MDKKLWTATELEKMTPVKVRAISDAAIVTDLSKVDPELVDTWQRTTYPASRLKRAGADR